MPLKGSDTSWVFVDTFTEMRFPLSGKIFPWKKFSGRSVSVFQNQKIERWGGAMRKKRTDAGQKRGNYNCEHGLLRHEHPRA
jgi:hypothetical protein